MKIELKNIHNIIFDLGNVLLNLDFDASIRAFHELGLSKDLLNKQQAYADPVFYNLEVGKISISEFRDGVRHILNNPTASDQQIDDAWYAMILDIPKKRVETVMRLKERYRVFLFSNTNAVHIDRLKPKFRKAHSIDFESLFESTFYSHEIKARKPDLEAYQKVIKLANVNPAETLFVDDLEKNIVAAQSAGLKTFCLKKGMEMAELF